jgi:hypothetical protein
MCMAVDFRSRCSANEAWHRTKDTVEKPAFMQGGSDETRGNQAPTIVRVPAITPRTCRSPKCV